MHYQNKALILILSMICLMLTLAANIMGDTIPPTVETEPAQKAEIIPVPMDTNHAPTLPWSPESNPPVSPAQPEPTAPTAVQAQPAPVAVQASAGQSSQPMNMQASQPVAPSQNQPSTQSKPPVANITPPAPKLAPAPQSPVKIGLADAPNIDPTKPVAVTPKPAPRRPAPIKIAAKPAPRPILKPAPEPVAPQADTGFMSRVLTATKSLVGRAVSWLGTRYVWGGISKAGVDCSGLMKLLYQGEGVNLPRVAKQQFKRGIAIARVAMLPGDLVFFNTTRGPLTHVGMYIGNGQFVHAANPRRGVRIDKLDSDYFRKRFAGARRYKDLG